jgi:hypothetical protein
MTFFLSSLLPPAIPYFPYYLTPTALSTLTDTKRKMNLYAFFVYNENQKKFCCIGSGPWTLLIWLVGWLTLFCYLAGKLYLRFRARGYRTDVLVRLHL